MGDSPKAIDDKLKLVTGAWEKLRPTKSFGGMTLAQFKARVQPSADFRATIIDLEQKLGEATNDRDDADAESMEAVKLVVNGVKGDPEEGEDGALYEAMGYVRASERKSGLKRASAKKPTA